jgi:chorismate synthase
VGVVIDGCPAGVAICEEDIARELRRRRPGGNCYVSPRQEEDAPRLLSGVFEGATTGAPVAIWIENRDADSTPYDAVRHLLKPGHAQFTYLAKYGVFDHRGGGRASARETAARVAAGAVAKALLASWKIACWAYLFSVGEVICGRGELGKEYPLFCPDSRARQEVEALLDSLRAEGDSIGGIVEGRARVGAGLGEPIYGKVEALLAGAMLSLPASKGFEIGAGFGAARMRGSVHNDPFVSDGGAIRSGKNDAGGTLGGITTGEEIVFRVAFKPPSSIQQTQQSVDLSGAPATYAPPQGRHDPCVAIRAVPVVEAMTALTLADLALRSRLSHLPDTETS